MVLREVKPTRSELMEVKRRIKLSESGYELLKKKRDGLILEFRNILERAIEIRERMEREMREAEERMRDALCYDGSLALEAAALAIESEPEVIIKSKNIMGVVVPIIEASRVEKNAHERGYGIIGTSSRIDEVSEAYERLLETVILSAEIETTMRRLLEEIDKTKRRVNALEYRVIPELREIARFIQFRLEEMERENIFMLKRIKAKK
ncbi:MAG: V/A-type H+/Na+-transporting ATPase subunit [Archaeoglobi archaeon]|nr:V-type ATP synthase subunit D [Candidatus Mnemosynella bozhongmuii]MDI3502307.1 V/A-type H+/Na+-transporting ATPase subunit [Archaeoglobi archaeon]MDK2781645.1 V/A-type H+/Na+-transporting ATPase subunit [Archaeoglobi archaeon]